MEHKKETYKQDKHYVYNTKPGRENSIVDQHLKVLIAMETMIEPIGQMFFSIILCTNMFTINFKD